MFFAFREQLKSRHKYYSTNFGFDPIFKAGVHFGKLMIAEVGTVKKEIAYHGDVINTASRIQNLCNIYKASLLVSERILNSLELSNLYMTNSKGTIALKGKEKEVQIFEIYN